MGVMVVMIRHGESEANAHDQLVSDAFDPVLTASGRLAARHFAELWKGQSVSALYASPLRRTQETAEVIAHLVGVDSVHIDSRLHEIHMGAFDGQVIHDLEPLNAYQTWKHDPEIPPPGGERLSAVYARMDSFLKELPGKHSGRVFVVPHADCLKAVTLGVLGAPWQGSHALHFENLAALQLEVSDNHTALRLLPSVPVHSD